MWFDNKCADEPCMAAMREAVIAQLTSDRNTLNISLHQHSDKLSIKRLGACGGFLQAFSGAGEPHA
jgi:hypothetical protein